MTPYNYAASVGRALDAGATTLLDPKGTGTVTVAPNGVGILVCNVAGDRTLQDAAGVDLGTEVLVLSTASSVTVNTVTVEDGGHATFKVTLNSSGVNQWVLVESSAAIAALGSVDFATAPEALGAANINTGDATTDTALIALADALQTLGLITHTWT